MKLTKKEEAIILGSLLGDGCMEMNGNHVRLRIEHGLKQEEYLLWKYDALKRWMTKTSPMKVCAYHKKHKRSYESFRIYTCSNEVFDGYFQTFYSFGRKIVPLNISDILKHPLSLAVWFMDDGYKRNDCNAFRFNTDMFSISDQKKLQKMLKQNFGVESKLHKKGRYRNLYIPRSSSVYFCDVVKRYIIPDLRYKITLTP